MHHKATLAALAAALTSAYAHADMHGGKTPAAVADSVIAEQRSKLAERFEKGALELVKALDDDLGAPGATDALRLAPASTRPDSTSGLAAGRGDSSGFRRGEIPAMRRRAQTEIGRAMLEVTARGAEFENGAKLGTRSIVRFSDAWERRQAPQ